MAMKKLVALLGSISCIVLITFCMAGCGPDYRPNFVGDWRVVSMQDSNGTDLTPTIEQLAAVNKYLTLSLVEEADEATFDLADQTTLKGTWKPTGESACVIAFEGYDEIPATLSEDGNLVFEENEQVMTCEKLLAE